MWTGDQYTQIKRMIERNEGRKAHPYHDQVGKLTIGVGRNLTDNGLDDQEIDFLLNNDIEDARRFLTSYPWFIKLAWPRQMALIDMVFNLGPAAFGRFKTMLRYLAEGNYDAAADEIGNSLWARQVPARAYRDEQQLRTGEIVG